MDEPREPQEWLAELVAKFQELRQRLERLISLMQMAGEISEAKAEALRQSVVGPLDKSGTAFGIDETATEASERARLEAEDASDEDGHSSIRSRRARRTGGRPGSGS
jgi:ElaB/YqjD/DUF883 family membrane-anchored ribosome-binding protein